MDLLPVFSSSTDDADQDVAAESSEENMVARNKCLWSQLPEEILSLILKALPPHPYCQFRCVSKRWKQLLSSPPNWGYWKRKGTLCSIVVNSYDDDIKILCHSDDKCLSVPFNADLHPKLDLASEFPQGDYQLDVPWRLVDVDEGLFCYYRRGIDKMNNLAVCNPVTKSIKLTYVYEYEKCSSYTLKLVVDREKKSFTIVYLEESGPFSVFSSTTAKSGLDYKYFSSPRGTDDFFVWKGFVYAYKTGSDGEETMFAFDLNADVDPDPDVEPHWDVVLEKFPGGNADRFIVSDKTQVLLVQCYCGERPYLEVWKLKDDGSSSRPDFSLSMWENLQIGRKVAKLGKAKTRCLIHICCAPEYMCFVFSATYDPNVKNPFHGVRGPGNDICVKYSFRTKTSSVISCPPGWKTEFWGWEGYPPRPGCFTFKKLFPWEPNENLDFGERE